MSSSDHATSDQAFLTRAYNLSNNVDDARTLYDEWASTYDKTLADPSHDYVAPALAAAELLDLLNTNDNGSKNTATQADASPRNVEILDAGCGTGIVGVALVGKVKHSLSQNTTTPTPSGSPLNLNLQIDGIDLSSRMLDVARETKIYRSLSTADLSGPPPSVPSISDNSYDGVICVGVLTEGHVGPNALSEFVRVTRPGGWIVATVKQEIWETKGFASEVERLGNEKVKVVSTELRESLRGKGVQARMVVLRVL